jgi:hypothetical protein
MIKTRFEFILSDSSPERFAVLQRYSQSGKILQQV